MKYFTLIFSVIVLWSCSGRKRVIETEKPKESTKAVVKAKDSIVPGKTMATVSDSIVKKETIEQEKEAEETDSFNEIVKKKFTMSHKLWDELLSKHVSKEGHVNYRSFNSDRKKLLDYISFLNVSFSNGAFKTLPKEEKLAFWINAYNVMTIDLILRHYPVKSIKDINKPWEQRYWKLGENWYNLNEIEHKILRKMDEPRIHFAIVCASVSCPKLSNEAYNASNLEAQLTKATKVFLNDSTKNNISKNSLNLSKIFQWFAKDFKQHGNLIDFLNQYANVQVSAKAKKSFKSYDWGLNE